MAGHCLACGKGDDFSDKYVACDLCEKWFHKKCVFLQNVKDCDVKKMKWMCDNCKDNAMCCYMGYGKTERRV